MRQTHRSEPSSHPALATQLVFRAKRAAREEAATRASAVTTLSGNVTTLSNSVSDLDGRVGTLENV